MKFFHSYLALFFPQMMMKILNDTLTIRETLNESWLLFHQSVSLEGKLQQLFNDKSE